MSSYNTTVYRRQNDGNLMFNGEAHAVFNVTGSATLAEINAGKTILTGVAGKQIKVVGGRIKSNGAFTTLTAIQITEGDGSPAIATYAQAQLTDGAVFDLRVSTSGQTIGSGFLSALTAGQGLSISKTGSTGAGGTSVDYTIDFVLV